MKFPKPSGKKEGEPPDEEKKQPAQGTLKVHIGHV